jgi:hypothetical protein
MVIVGVFLFGNITMLLWNYLMPVIFHLPLISFWQALGLILLSKILFGGFRGGPRFHAKRDNLRQAWMNMNPEQREKFKQEWGGRCGGRGERGRGRGPFESWDRSTEGRSGQPGEEKERSGKEERGGQTKEERAGQNDGGETSL